MGKKKVTNPVPSKPVAKVKPLSSRGQRLVDDAYAAIDRKNFAQAQAMLVEANRRDPDHPVVLELLAEVAHDQGNYPEFLRQSDRLVRMFPNNPDYQLNRAGAYLSNVFPVLAMRTFQHFLTRWPTHPQAGEVRKELVRLEPPTVEMLTTMGYPPPDGWELGARHEEMQVALILRDFARVCEMGEKLLQKWPNFPAAYNNMAHAQMQLGNLEQAVALPRRLLEIEPNNGHALGNLIGSLCQAGNFDEARTLVDRLTHVPMKFPEWWLKRAEALSVLGDDAGVVGAFEEAQREGVLENILPRDAATFLHFAATAYSRLGSEGPARRLWQEALRQYPGQEQARENLADLDRPPHQRQGAYPFPLATWVSTAVIRELEAESQKNQAGALAAFLQKHPELITLAPTLLERGGQQGQNWVFILARMTRNPELLELLRQFTLGQKGSLKVRNDTLGLLNQLGVIPNGTVPLWDGKEWKDALVSRFEVHRQPLEQLDAKAAALVNEAIQVSIQGDSARSEALFRQALEIQPRVPSLRFNLANQLRAQGRHQEAEALLTEVIDQHPSYFFGQTELVRRHVRSGNLQEAEKLLYKLGERDRLHVDELAALTLAHVENSLARNQPEMAQVWISILERHYPESIVLRQVRGMLPRS